ncbi:MAG: hypothetical protein M3003_12595 [Candidatus Dormibacteraeota bacterium]|nr:hypothetical protein [Candidatus Dormibacteraeota bacterium]
MMGLFSARDRLPQPAGDRAPVRLHLQETLTRLVHRFGSFSAQLGQAARGAVENVGKGLTDGLGEAQHVAVSATNDARIVAVVLLLAAVALAWEMAASFHVI